MKIIVDEMPDTPEDCLFSEERHVHDMTVYVCNLREWIDGKPKNVRCLCKRASECPHLAVIET